MNYALTLRHPAPLKVGRLLMLVIALWLAGAVSLAPTFVRSAVGGGHAKACHCAHCPGGALCCCRSAGACP